MEPLQFALFFAALLIAYVLVHIRLVRFEAYIKHVTVLKDLNDRLRGLAEGLGSVRVDRVEESLQQLHEDLRQLHQDLIEVQEVEKKIERGQIAVRDAVPAAAAGSAAATAADRIRSVVEERLLQLGYHNLRILTDLSEANLDQEIEVRVECERREMPYKGRVTTLNGSVNDVDLQNAAQTFP